VLVLLVTLAMAAALVLVWIRVVQTLTQHVERQPPIGQPRSIVWNDRVFTTDRQLKRYLEGKGLSYTGWVSKHPAAFAVIQHELPASATATPAPKHASTPAKPARTTHATTTTAAPATAAPSKTASQPTVKSSGSRIATRTLVVAALVVLETLLVLVAFAPVQLVPPFFRGFYELPERRIGVFAVALTILFGLLLSLWVG
jgi:hypothetical protein